MKLLLLTATAVALAFGGEEFYCVQLATSKDFSSIKRLYRHALHLRDVRVERIGKYYVLRAGFFVKKENALRLLERSRLAFRDAFVRRCLFIPERIVIPDMSKPRRTRFFTYEVGMKLASLYLKKKDLPRAEMIYRELAEMYPDSREVRLQLARVLYWQGKYEESLRIYKYLERFEPELADERRRVEVKKALREAEDLEKAGRLEEAIRILEKIYREEKDYSAGLKLGLLLMKAGLRERASSVFLDLLLANPRDEEVRRLYLLALQRPGGVEDTGKKKPPMRKG
ncbi:MAG: tetratricopeptide repeat protein [Aquificota bacterium]|nr:tetratricopeptide repeat protein [Aquificota bacterium]